MRFPKYSNLYFYNKQQVTFKFDMSSLFFKNQKASYHDPSSFGSSTSSDNKKLKYAYQRMKHNMALRNGGSLWPLNENYEFAFRQQPTIQNSRPIIHQQPLPDPKLLFEASETIGARNLKV